MKVNRRIFIVAGAAILCLSIALLLIKENRHVSLSEINEHVYIGEIKLGTSEDELIRLWGPGDYQPAFGGHRRDYKEKMIVIGIAGDKDNDLFHQVSSIDIQNPEYSVFDIRIGETVSEAAVKLQNHGFKFTGELFNKGEFTVAIRGEGQVNLIQIWFNDKDLRDRLY